MADRDITCTLCRSEIPPGFTVCPKCGTKVGELLSARPSAQQQHGIKAGSSIAVDLPVVPLPVIKHSCPFCALEVGPAEKKCPRCGAPMHADEAMIECPDCGALEFVGSGSCSKCGASLTKKVAWAPTPIPATPPPVPVTPASHVIPARELAPKVEPVPLIQTPPAPPPVIGRIAQGSPKVEPRPVEKTTTVIKPPDTSSKLTLPPQGFTNGRGAVNGNYRGNINGTRTGAINGVGMTNGRGAVKGTGLVNGTGLTNGASLGVKPTSSGRRLTAAFSWKIIIVLVIIVLLIPSVIFVSYRGHPSGTAIDGSFDDWNDVQKFGMRIVASQADVAVYEWAVKNSGSALSMFLRVQGAVMGSAGVDSYYLFVDSDNSAETGYYVAGMGADYLLELQGWSGNVESGTLMEYGSADTHNWTAWTLIGSLNWASQSGALEAMGSLPVILDGSARYLLLSKNNVPDPVYSISYPVPESGRVLVIRQEPGPSVSSLGTIPAGPSESIVSLVLKCAGKAGTIESIDPLVSGANIVSPIANIPLTAGEEKAVNLLVDASGASDASSVYVYLSEEDVLSTFDEVVIEGDTVSAYVSVPPASVKIDGAFGDWIGRTAQDEDLASVRNPDVNITATGTSNSSAQAAFYVSVEGKLCDGTYVPSTKSKPTTMGGGGGYAIERRQSGEDMLRVYIDSDQSNLTGEVISYPNKTIGADYKIEIAGIYGQISSQSMFMHTSTGWTPISAPISAAKDAQRIEFSVPSLYIGGSQSFASIIETTDWRSRGDWAWAGVVPDPWVVDAAGNTYQTADGLIWNYLGAPALVAGDRVVDIAMSSNDATVFVVTNTGRTFYWDLGISTNWTAGQTQPIDTANYSEAVSMAFYQRWSAWLLTKNGSYFWLMDATSSRKAWTFQDVAASGVTDFTDIVYAGGTMYALRSGPNTGLLYSMNGNSFTAVTYPTGSTTPQTEFTFIPGGPGGSNDRIFVLCENGDIRYSTNGGSVWSSLGNLPRPTGGNHSKYTGLGIDPEGYMWVVTDTGYCYRSTDVVNYNTFAYVGRSPIIGIVAVVPLPIIPEFQYLLAPAVFSIVVFSLLRRSSGRGDSE